MPPLLIDHNGQLTGFMLTYSKMGSSNTHSVQLASDTTAYSINQLIPSTMYRVQVACVNVNGTGPYSAFVDMLSGDDSKLSINTCMCIDM